MSMGSVCAGRVCGKHVSASTGRAACVRRQAFERGSVCASERGQRVSAVSDLRGQRMSGLGVSRTIDPRT